MKVLHKFCNTDMLRVLLIYSHSPLGTAHPQDRPYVSVKPLAAALQYIMYTYMYVCAVCTYEHNCVCICMYVRMYACMYVCIYVCM